MNLAELLTALESTGFPVAFASFCTDENPPLPNIVYSLGEEHIFYADGVSYFCGQTVQISLYTARKDSHAEELLRTALEGVPCKWQQSSNETEHRYEYTITTEVL